MGQPSLSKPTDRPVQAAPPSTSVSPHDKPRAPIPPIPHGNPFTRDRRMAQTPGSGCIDPRACGPEIEEVVTSLAPILTALARALQVVEVATAAVVAPEVAAVVAGAAAMMMTGDSESDSDSEHTKNARESSRGKHEKGQARKGQDKGGEMADPGRGGSPLGALV